MQLTPMNNKSIWRSLAFLALAHTNYLPSSAFGAAVPAVVIGQPAVLYVSPSGDDSTAVRGGKDSGWQTINAAVTNSLPGDEIRVAAGQYVLSTNVVLKERQKLIGDGPSTVILWTNSTPAAFPSITSESRVAVELAAGVEVANLTILAPSNNAAGIGVGSLGATATNTTLRTLNVIAAQDALWFDNYSVPIGLTAFNCTFSGSPNAVNLYPFGTKTPQPVTLNLMDCVIQGTLRCVGRTTNQISVFGGILDGGAGLALDHFWVQVNLFGVEVKSSSNFWAHIHSGDIKIYGGNLTLDRIVSTADSNVSTPGSAIPRIDENRVQNIRQLLSRNTGNLIWSKADNRFKMYNGITWQPLTPRMDTNRVMITGEGGGFDGVYTYRTNFMDVTIPGLVFTNSQGKFLLYSEDFFTNETTVAASPWVLSSIASITNEAVLYDIADFLDANGFDGIGWGNGGKGYFVPFPENEIFTESYAAGTNSGTAAPSKTWTRIQLNTTAMEGGLLSVANGVMMVGPSGTGDWLVVAHVPCVATGTSSIKLRRTNNSPATLLTGQTSVASGGSSAVSLEMRGKVSLVAGDTLELQGFAETGGGHFGSSQFNTGEAIVYSVIEFTKL